MLQNWYLVLPIITVLKVLYGKVQCHVAKSTFLAKDLTTHIAKHEDRMLGGLF
jgi:hypothetical protein